MTDEPRLLELEVTNVAHGGVFVARAEGRVVFVSDAIPGERVLARVVDRHRDSFWRAETVQVLTASPDRRAHIWGAASLDRDPAHRAGGAEFGHIELNAGRVLKAQVLADALTRFADLDLRPDVEPPLPMPRAAPEDAPLADGTRWRTRVTLHVSADGRLGPFAARSHTVIPVDDLPLATAAIEAAADLGRRRRPASRGGRGRGGRPAAFDLVHDGSGRVGEASAAPITERVGEREFQLAGSGFWQVHPDAAWTLSATVGAIIDPDRFHADAPNLDLYGGVGLLAAAVGDRFDPSSSITSVESSGAATGFARRNLADLPGAAAVTARVDSYLTGVLADSDGAELSAYRNSTIVLDPPRSGAGREVVAQLSQLAPAQIVYVACDPVAFARDAGYLGQAGYSLASIRAFDLFPHTHHLECVALFLR